MSTNSDAHRHIDVLGLLHIVWGGLGILTGASLLFLAASTHLALIREASVGRAETAAVWVLATVGVGLSTGGIVCAISGQGLRAHRPQARISTLVMGVPNLLLVPFGTALGIYAFWVLLNDDARRLFGRPLRADAGRAS